MSGCGPYLPSHVVADAFARGARPDMLQGWSPQPLLTTMDISSAAHAGLNAIFDPSALRAAQ